jgi:two-component system sensor histidine kinase YesM
MSIKRMYSNLSIKYKLLIFVYIVISLISLVFGSYFYTTSKKQVLQKVSTANSEVMKQISSNIEFIQKSIDELSTYISISRNVQSMFSDESSNYTNMSSGNLQNVDSLNFILNAIVSKNYITGIILYNRHGKPIYFEFTDGSSGVPSIEKSKDYDVYNKMLESNGKPVWFSLSRRSDFLIRNNVTPKLGIGRVVKNVYNTEVIGSIFIFIDQKYIENIYKSYIKTAKDSIFITDANNEIVSSSGVLPSAEEINTIIRLINNKPSDGEYLTEKISGENMLITYSPINFTGWKTYYFTPTNTMVNQINSVKFLTLLIIFSCIIISFPLLIFITSYFTKPLKNLLASMERFEKGNFDEKVSFNRNDEIGMLGEGYNRMIQNIKDLINKTYVLQIKEREAELNALQAQINPHFLYNTLNSIFWKAQKNKQLEIAEMTMLLSQMFRLNLNRGKDWIVIEKEIELISCYLKLQKMRYNDRLQFTINIDEEMLNYLMPKFIIQPFVENAVLHGIDDRTNGIEVIITGTLSDSAITFIIEDNGLGMSEETVDKLNSLNFEAIQHSKEGSGYAIKNIIEKLELIFDDKYKLFFTSELGKGTKVQITIPIIGGSENDQIANNR